MNVTCPHCQLTQETNKNIGDLVRCELCQKVFEVPDPKMRPKPRPQPTTHNPQPTTHNPQPDEDDEYLSERALYKNNKYAIFENLAVILIFVVLIFLMTQCSSSSSTNNQNSPQVSETTEYSSVYSNEHLIEAIKEQMEKRHSFKLLNIYQKDREPNKDYVMVYVEYEEKNSNDEIVKREAVSAIRKSTGEVLKLQILPK